MDGTSMDKDTVPRDMRSAAGEALVQPGGVPRVMEGEAAVETEVTSWPLDVMMNVTRVGEGDSVGMAVALT